jgi:tyrosyl-tRNA synthetase
VSYKDKKQFIIDLKLPLTKQKNQEMNFNLVEELKWRGMIHDSMPGIEEQFQKELTVAYVGFDPTGDSLHIGHLVSIMMLKQIQLAGHKPLALVGGATGMIGDPSGKSEERNLLSEEVLQHNVQCLTKQLKQFLDFGAGPNAAEIVNNYDWFKNMSFLEFLREVGKHLTVSYMLAKDSVQKRLETGLSFTEFSYQLVQGFDFYYLYTHKNCKVQMGGADQWGNIVAGTELIRRKTNGEVSAFALTCPLITKADGSKFGKTESGSVWLDPEKTSPYKFYQFWLNTSDLDASRYIRIFTLFTEAEILALETEHAPEPHLRILQKALAKDVTRRVHADKACQSAIDASEILFGKGSADILKSLSEEDLLAVFEGVPQVSIDKNEFVKGIGLLELLAEKSTVFPSKGEARKMIQGGGVAINKEKIEDINTVISSDGLLKGKYMLAQKGKKNYYLIKAV